MVQTLTRNPLLGVRKKQTIVRQKRAFLPVLWSDFRARQAGSFSGPRLAKVLLAPALLEFVVQFLVPPGGPESGATKMYFFRAGFDSLVVWFRAVCGSALLCCSVALWLRKPSENALLQICGLGSGGGVCVCLWVCVCARERACVRVCVLVCASVCVRVRFS